MRLLLNKDRNSLLQLGKSIGAGLATIRLARAGVGVGVVFGSLFCTTRHEADIPMSRVNTYEDIYLALEKIYGINKKIIPLYSFFFSLCFIDLHPLFNDAWKNKKTLSFAEMLIGLVYDPHRLGLNAKIFKQVFDAHLNEHLENYTTLACIWITYGNEKASKTTENHRYIISMIQDRFLSYLKGNFIECPDVIAPNEKAIFPLTKLQYDKSVYQFKLKLKHNFEKIHLKLNDTIIHLGLSDGSTFYLSTLWSPVGCTNEMLNKLSTNFREKKQKQLVIADKNPDSLLDTKIE